jgi:predicted kinase
LTHPIPLLLLIGLPGSGKSTWAAQWVAHYPDSRVISTDEIRSRLYGDPAIQGNWRQIWREVERQMQQVVAEIFQGRLQVAIYDATHTVRRQRREAIGLARQVGFTDITGVWLDTPLALCLERNQQRDRQVPEAVILHMHRCLQDAPPAIDDGCDQITIIQS